MAKPRIQDKFIVERVQTGVRMEKRLLKVLKAFAEFHDLTLGDLLEGIVLHAFDGKTPFAENSRRQIKELKKFYGLDLNFRASHRLTEAKTRRQAETSSSRRPNRVKAARRRKSPPKKDSRRSGKTKTKKAGGTK